MSNYAINDLILIRGTRYGDVPGRVEWIEEEPHLKPGTPRLVVNMLHEARKMVVMGIPSNVEVISSSPPEAGTDELWRRHSDFINALNGERRNLTSQSERRILEEIVLIDQNSMIPIWIRNLFHSKSGRLITYPHDVRVVDTPSRWREQKLSGFVAWLNNQFGTAYDPEQMAYVFAQSVPDPTQYTFDIVEGGDITTYYNRSEAHSCMSGTGHAILYALNPTKVKLLVINRSGRYLGRALVWKTDQGKIAMDRIYPSDGGMHIRLAQDYARAQGWTFLNRQSYSQPFEDGGAYSVTLAVNPNRFPYMDTFRFTDRDTVHNAPLTLRNTMERGDLELSHTNGTADGSRYYPTLDLDGDDGDNDGDDDDYGDDEEEE